MANPSKTGTLLYWLSARTDTVLTRSADSLPRNTLAVRLGKSAHEVVFIGFTASTRQFALYDLAAQHRIMSVAQSTPLLVPDAANPSALWSVEISGNAGIAFAEHSGVVLLGAHTTGFVEQGLLAIDVATFRALWFLRGHDIVALSSLSDGGDRIWIAQRHVGGVFGQYGSVLVFNTLTQKVVDSVTFPARTAPEIYPYSFTEIESSDHPSTFAVTAGFVFVCGGAALACRPTQIPGSGVIARRDSVPKFLQLVGSEIGRNGNPPGLRLLANDGTVTRSFTVPELAANYAGGVFGTLLSSPPIAVLTYGSDYLAGAPGERGAVSLFSLGSGQIIWSARLDSLGIQPGLVFAR